MTVLTISQDTLVMLPDGATGGTVQISYNGTTVGPVVASGDDQGRAVIVQGRLAKLTALDGKSPLQIAGREAGGRLPARVTLRIYPAGSATVAPIILSGLPVGSPDAPGIWDLSNIDDASGGMDVITPAERTSLALLKERGLLAAERAEGASAVAVAAEGKASAAISNLNSSVSSAATQAAQQAMQGTQREWADIKRDTAQTASQLSQQQEGNNAQTAMNIGRRTALKVALIGAAAGLYNVVSGQEAGQVWEVKEEGGAPVRRPELEAATQQQLGALNSPDLDAALASTSLAPGTLLGACAVARSIWSQTTRPQTAVSLCSVRMAASSVARCHLTASWPWNGGVLLLTRATMTRLPWMPGAVTQTPMAASLPCCLGQRRWATSNSSALSARSTSWVTVPS